MGERWGRDQERPCSAMALYVCVLPTGLSELKTISNLCLDDLNDLAELFKFKQSEIVFETNHSEIKKKKKNFEIKSCTAVISDQTHINML